MGLIILVKDAKITEDLEYPKEVEIVDTYRIFCSHFGAVKTFHSLTPILAQMVFGGDMSLRYTVEKIRAEGFGVKNAVYGIDLVLRLQDQKKMVVWRHPETGLHPKYAANMGDVVILLSRPRGEWILNNLKD